MDARVCSRTLLAWRTLRAYRLTLEPPRYIRRAPTMCHVEVKNSPTLVRGPNSGALHHNTRFQSQKAGFLGRMVPKLARIGGARVRTYPFGVAHLTRIPIDLRTITIHQKGPYNVSFWGEKRPNIGSGPQLWFLPSYHPFPSSKNWIFRQNVTKNG